MEYNLDTKAGRLGFLIETLGLSKGEFAKRADISQSLVSNILTGNNGPSRATVNLICNTYKVNKEWLREGKGEMFIKKPEPKQKETVIKLDGETLKDDEAELVGIYQKLEKPTKRKVLTYAHDMLDVQTHQTETEEKRVVPEIEPENGRKVG